MGSLARRARRQAEDLVRAMDLTTPCRCGSCGGAAAVVAMISPEPLTCPWCGTPRLPCPALDETIRESVAALVEEQGARSQATTDRFTRGLLQDELMAWLAGALSPPP